jgi:SRSO17 transposase
VAAGHSVELDPARWQELFEELMERVAGRFARADLRRRARAFVRGLLADLPRKNCWTIAEHAGHPNPDGMQHLLARAVWDHEGVRDDVRGYVVEHLGDPGAAVPTAASMPRPLSRTRCAATCPTRPHEHYMCNLMFR